MQLDHWVLNRKWRNSSSDCKSNPRCCSGDQRGCCSSSSFIRTGCSFYTEAFSRRTACFSFNPDWIWQEFNVKLWQQHGSPLGSDTCGMLPITTIGSLLLLLSGSKNKIWSAHFECDLHFTFQDFWTGFPFSNVFFGFLPGWICERNPVDFGKPSLWLAGVGNSNEKEKMHSPFYSIEHE